MMTKLTALIFAAASLAATPSFAGTYWNHTHPRRAEVNGRLGNQDARIHAGARDGQLTPGQAHRLHREDHAIRGEERAMAARNGGHLTRPEQRRINRQENRVSGQIYRERR